MKSRIYFIRHGITEGNLRRWYYGKADIPLVEEGRESLRKYLSMGVYPKIDRGDFYTTGLLRTEETFEIIFGDRPHTQLGLLREMNFGDYECKSYDELKLYESFDKWAYDKTGTVKLPGGESRNEFSERVSLGLSELIGFHRLNDLSNRHSGKDSLSAVVCHGGVISVIMRELFPDTGRNMWDWIPAPGLGYAVDLKDGQPMAFESIEVGLNIGEIEDRKPVIVE